jgi:hypothetical protein
MILILFAVVVYASLLLGSLVFVICALIGPLRKYALSAALWCALWGPCCDAFATLAGLGLVAGNSEVNAGSLPPVQLQRLIATYGWSYLAAAILMTAVVATAASWIHQKLVRRFTFPLFRLYAATVAGGIGSVFGCALGLWVIRSGFSYLGISVWVAGTLALTVLFSMGAFKNAGRLRGAAPTKFTWISADEFAGN